MIPNAQKIQVSGNLPVAGRRFSFDEDSVAHIMRILIDLYSDAELAVIRELSTNAIDSHIMAGNPDPIRVYTPSPLSPYLIVRDQGLGLSVDEIYGLFGKYGASTKRDSNAVTGMLGLGSKSPLTYTSQFTMTAVKDGVRAVVSITREADGVGALTVVDTAATDAPNGVEVKIPTRADNEMDAKAREFFSYWPTGTILLNDTQPDGLADAVMRLSDGLYIEQRPRYEDVTSVVIMGNVPYPAPDLSYSALGLPYGYRAIAYVPMGAVEVTPSREGLADDSTRTKATLADLKTAVRKNTKAAVQAKVDAAESEWAAHVEINKWQALVGGRQAITTWRARPITHRYQLGPGERAYMMRRHDHSRQRVGGHDAIDMSHALSALLVHDFDMADVTITHKRKIHQWAAAQNGRIPADIQHYIFVEGKTPLTIPWPANRMVDWATIKAERLPKAGPMGPTGLIPGSYDVRLGGKANPNAQTKHGVKGSEIDQTKPVYWFHGNVHSCGRYTAILDHHHDAYTIICLPENRIEKFKRENPSIPPVSEHVNELAQKALKVITPDQRTALAISDQGAQHALKALGKAKTRILDPDIREAIRLAKINVEPIDAIRRRFRHHSWPKASWPNPLDAYALWDGYRSARHIEESVRYLNNEYRHRQRATA